MSLLFLELKMSGEFFEQRRKVEIFIKQAAEKAKEVPKGGDTVILSPACASFDLFKNFEERGNTFKNIVKGF